MAFGDRYTFDDLQRSRRFHRTGILLTVEQVDDLLREFDQRDANRERLAYEAGMANASCDCGDPAPVEQVKSV